MAVDPGVPDDQAVSPVGDQQATDAGESRCEMNLSRKLSRPELDVWSFNVSQAVTVQVL
jgi:hypothetical protein